MQPPGGGPEDKDSPEIVWTIPTRDSVRVNRKVDILISFNEKMNRESVENSVYLSPFPSGDIKFSWKKNVLKIELDDSLESDKTFVVTLGTDGKDIHANPLQQAYSFAFSTGDSIDRGSISGRVIAENTTGISIWAYRINDPVAADSLVYRKRADYITQVGAGGKYKLSYLSPGKYRIYAIADLDVDYLYTPSSDFIGLTFKDISVSQTQPESADNDFMVFQEDTAKFRLQTVVPVDNRVLVAGFSKSLLPLIYLENVANAEGLMRHFKLTDSITGKGVNINDIYLNTANLHEVRMFTELRDIQRRYILSATGLQSQTGEALNSDEMVFSGGEDTSNIRVEVEMIKPHLKDGSVMPDEVFAFRFSNGVQRNSLEKYFKMTDSLGKEIDGLFTWTHSAQVEFRPAKLLESRMTYEISIGADSANDWHGKVLSDTALKYSFRSFKTDSLGLISGTVINEDSVKPGRYYVTCRSLNRSSRDYSTQIDKGPFMLNYLVPGRYSIIAFWDEDGNGVFSYGRVSPITFSERFTSYSDTVVVRPNWETSNIILRFKE